MKPCSEQNRHAFEKAIAETVLVPRIAFLSCGVCAEAGRYLKLALLMLIQNLHEI